MKQVLPVILTRKKERSMNASHVLHSIIVMFYARRFTLHMAPTELAIYQSSPPLYRGNLGFDFKRQ